MQTRTIQDPDFQAMKDITRLSWLLNFEAVATVANDEDALDSGLQY